MAFSEAQQSFDRYPSDSAGRRVGWVAVSETMDFMASVVDIHIATATVTDPEAYAYGDSESTDIYELSHGLTAVRALSANIMYGDRRGKQPTLDIFLRNVTPTDDERSQLDAFRTGADGTLEPADRIWAHSGMEELLPTLRQQLDGLPLSDQLYATMYYGYNLPGIDSNAADELLLDSAMAVATRDQIEVIEQHARVMRLQLNTARTIKSLTPKVKERSRAPIDPAQLERSEHTAKAAVLSSYDKLLNRLLIGDALGIATSTTSPAKAMKRVERSLANLRRLSEYEDPTSTPNGS